MRIIAREVAFKLIYEYLFLNEKRNLLESELVMASNVEQNDFSYMETVYGGVTETKEELVEIIASKADGFSINRIFKIDLAIMLLAVYEMKYCKDIPNSVSINEAVELAKIYSTEKSGKYINGVLGAISKSLEDKN